MDIDFTTYPIRMFSTISMLMFLWLSYHVVREDIASQKIPNKLIMKFLKMAGVMYAVLLAYGLLGHDPFCTNYAVVNILNAAVALVVGYVLWYFDIFSPGDAKYFALAALLIPLESYIYQFVPGFPSILVLINAYVIAFLCLLAYTLYLLGRKGVENIAQGRVTREYVRAVGGNIKAKFTDTRFLFTTLGLIVMIMSIILVMRLANDFIQDNIKISSGHFALLKVLVLYGAVVKLMEWMRNNRIVAMLAYFVFAGVVIMQYMAIGAGVLDIISQTLAASFFVAIVVPIARLLIDFYQDHLEMSTIEDLKMGTILTEDTVSNLKENWNVEVPAMVPLTDEQSEAVKKVVPDMEPMRQIKHITFGPFIFIGAVFTIIFHHTIVHFISR